jgi:AraC-type transcriptional regulator N-terminus
MLKHGKSGDANASRLSHLLTELGKKISNSLGDSAERATEVPGLILYRRTAPTVPNPSTYELSLLVIAQGRIRVGLGKANYVFGQSRFLLTSLELPVVSQVITASEKAPYLAFFLKLDMSTVRDILNTEEVRVPEATSGACGMATGETTIELANLRSRMMDLLDAPRTFHSLANSFNARSFIACCREIREHAFARLPRSRPSATGRRKRLPGCVPTTKSLCV